MDANQKKSSEIVSFNESIPELSDLLNLEGAALDQVVGGVALEDAGDCGSYCGTYCNTYSRA